MHLFFSPLESIGLIFFSFLQILLMNKTDLFQEKILQSGRHLRNYLSCYKGSFVISHLPCLKSNQCLFSVSTSLMLDLQDQNISSWSERLCTLHNLGLKFFNLLMSLQSRRSIALCNVRQDSCACLTSELIQPTARSGLRRGRCCSPHHRHVLVTQQNSREASVSPLHYSHWQCQRAGGLWHGYRPGHQGEPGSYPATVTACWVYFYLF